MPEPPDTLTPAPDHARGLPSAPVAPDAGLTPQERARLRDFLALPMGERVERGVQLSRAALSTLGAARRPPA